MNPFPTRIVGIDRPEAARDAVALATALGGQDGLILARTYVFDPEAGEEFAGYRRSLAEHAERELAAAAEASGVQAELVAVPEISPARGLKRLAERREADLLVVGASHRGRVGRAILGSVSRAVLHGAPCPVAVAPKGCADRLARPATIGVGYDGRPESRAALALAERAAEAYGARLSLLAAIPPPEAFPLAPEEFHGWVGLAEDAMSTAREALDEALAGLRVPAEGQVVSEHASRALERLSASVDLIVCGSRGWGAAKRVVLGSTSDRLIHRAECPVVVAPRVDDEQ